MILIADSGSTKTDWRLISEKEEVKSVSTPESILYQTEEEIENQISTLLYPELMGFSVKNLFTVQDVHLKTKTDCKTLFPYLFPKHR